MSSINIQQTIRRMPWTSFWVGSGSAVVATAAMTEFFFDMQENIHHGALIRTFRGTR
jgi:hypothetical protein